MSADKEHPGIPDLKLEKFLLGELKPEEMSRIEQKLESDPALRQRLEELDEVLAALVAGRGQAGEDLPGGLAPLGLVAAGQLAGDDRRTQGSLGRHGCWWLPATDRRGR